VNNAVGHLFGKLGVEEFKVRLLLQNKDCYYREWYKNKLNDDWTVKRINGIPQKRKISESIKDLKRIQSRIKDILLAPIGFPEYCYGGVKNRSNILNAKVHKGKKYIFTTDIKDFFPSITKQMVFHLFKKLGHSKEGSNFLAELVTYQGVLPQGTPTSSYIANLVFKEAGDRLDFLSRKNNITFTSFIDDLTFSSNNDFKPLTNDIIRIVKSSQFKINPKKKHYCSKPIAITGVITKLRSLEPPGKIFKRLELLEKSDPKYKVLENYKNQILKN